MSLRNINKCSFIVLNGARKGIYDFIKRNSYKLYLIQCTVRTNTTEEELYNLRINYPDTVSYYFYDSSNMKGQKTHDVDSPNMNLYNDYVKVGSSDDNVSSKQ